MKNLICISILLSYPLFSFSQFNCSPINKDSTTLNLGVDVYLCDGYIHLLDAGPGYDSYEWQDGSTNQTYMVTETGTYWVQAYLGSNMYADTIYVGYWPIPDPNLGNDTTLCYASAYYLEPTTGYLSYLWFNGSTSPIFLVTEPGTYHVDVMDIHGCMASDTIVIDYTTSHVELGSDTAICACGPLLLDAGEEFVFYEWQDSSHSQHFLVDFETFGLGYFTFTASVVDSIGCESLDSIHVLISECITDIYQTKSNQLRIYPNPANDVVNIDLHGFPDKVNSIEIFNSIGDLELRREGIKTLSNNKIKLGISDLHAGIYYLKIITDKRNYLNKLLIQK